MIKMIKGNKVISVPNTTKKIYERVGYEEYKQEVAAAEVVEEVAEEVKEAEENEIRDYTDKPIAQWSPAELKEYVKEYGVDLAGAKKTSEVREIVKAHLEG